MFHFCGYFYHPSELYISPKRPSQREVVSHRWTKGNTLIFESSSNWGFPKTLSMKISTISRNVDSRDDNIVLDDKGSLTHQSDIGCSFIDLCSIWTQLNYGGLASSVGSSARVYLFENAREFDQHGDAEENDTAEAVRLYNFCSIYDVDHYSYSTVACFL